MEELHRVALDVLQDSTDEELLAWALEVLGLAGGGAFLTVGFSTERYQHVSTSTSQKRLPRSMSITWDDLGRYGLFGKKGIVHSFGSASSSAFPLKRSRSVTATRGESSSYGRRPPEYGPL